MPNAARLSDSHTCPLTAPIPHVGGQIVGPGVTSVKIGNLPAATVASVCTCASVLPNAISKGSGSVMIGYQAAVRAGDPTAHGGVIVGGCATVLIGG